MKSKLIIIGLILNLVVLHAQDNKLTTDDFGTKASVHVKKLCDFGVRVVGSKAEKETIDYLFDQYKKNGMNVRLDTIEYKNYRLDSRSVFINGQKIRIKTAFINKPFRDTLSIESKCVKIQNDNFDMNNLTDKIIFTSIPNYSFALSKYNPKAVVVMDEDKLDSLDINDSQHVKIKFVGKSTSEWVKSYNIIATYKKKTPVDSSIIITAHWDSQNGVGANDNASGTAGLIELSNFFSKRLNDLKYNLVFVSTGLEEFGMLGSISYVFNHIESVDRCILNLNIDGIASDKPKIEISNTYNQSKSDTLQDMVVFKKRSSKGILMTSPWEIYFNHYTDKKETERIRAKFKSSMIELGIEYQKAGCCAGVDARSFNYMGIPYINLGSINPESDNEVFNTPKDVYNESFIEKINLNGKIASKILLDMNK